MGLTTDATDAIESIYSSLKDMSLPERTETLAALQAILPDTDQEELTRDLFLGTATLAIDGAINTSLPPDASAEEVLAKEDALHSALKLTDDLRKLARGLDPRKPSVKYDLETVETTLKNGDRALKVTFVIPKGVSGEMICQEVEKANPREDRVLGVVTPMGRLLKDPGLTDIASTDTTVTFYLCLDTEGLSRGAKEIYVERNGLKLADRWMLTIGGALFRDENGLPEDIMQFQTPEDKGDLFRGKEIMAEPGGICSSINGLAALWEHDLDREEEGRAEGRIAAAVEI